MSEERLVEFFNTLSAELRDCRPAAGAMSFAVERQFERARKRARFNKPDLHDKAVASFLETNDRVGNLTVTLDDQLVRDARHFVTTMLERFTSSQVEEAIQTPLDFDLVFDGWRFGPGASYGIKGSHAAQKISQSMTCTALSYPLVRKLRSRNPYFARFDCENKTDGTTIVRGSRLTTVLKNEDTMRTIAIEPLGSMALQLAAGRYLEGTLRFIGLDISKQQPKNKAYAKRGSTDGSLATIDLKSASDMIHPDLVRLLFPKDWFRLLMRLRSPEIELDDGRWVRLNMISTMGNGFTFPLMTLIISALIYGYRAQHGGPSLYIDWTDTCVYGDDIIIPTHEYDGITEVLIAAGLVVNHDKSYREGPFRESCGGDYYLGTDVTPFYVKSLSTPPEIYVALNQVMEWCSKTHVFLHRTILLLKGYLDGKVLLVPEWCNPDQGLLTSQCSRRYKYLQQLPCRMRLKPSLFDMMLAVGGYVTASGTDLFFSPRVYKPKVKVRTGRLPHGYLSGWDPYKRSQQVSDEIAMVIAVLF